MGVAATTDSQANARAGPHRRQWCHVSSATAHALAATPMVRKADTPGAVRVKTCAIIHAYHGPVYVFVPCGV